MNSRKINSIDYGTKYIRSFKKLPTPVKQKAREKEKLFRRNPFDPASETHKLHGKFRDYWAYSVDNKYRVIFRFLNGDQVLFFDIGLHLIYGKGE